MNGAVAKQALADYLQAAASWDDDRAAREQREIRAAWRVAGAGWACALTACAALMLLMPLKRVDPFVVRVDNSTGIVDVVPVYAGSAGIDPLVTRYFLAHYITICERFNFSTAESDYEECGALNAAQRNQLWAALWNVHNPASPLNIHKDGGAVRVQVESVSFLRRASGVADLAQVRYLKAERQAEGSAERFSHWIATLQYAYVAPSADARMRRWNPLGFRVVEMNAEPETPGSTGPGSP